MIAVTLGLWAWLAVASPAIRILVGDPVVPADVPPVVVQGRTLVPMRFVAEALGARVDSDPRTATVTRGETTVRLRVGERAAAVGASTVALDVPALVVDGQAIVPLRFVSRALGAEVDWDLAAREVRRAAGGAVVRMVDGDTLKVDLGAGAGRPCG